MRAAVVLVLSPLLLMWWPFVRRSPEGGRMRASLPPRKPTLPGARPPSPTNIVPEKTSVPVQVVFFETSPGSASIDCHTQAEFELAGRRIPRGFPLSLRVRRPTASVAEAISWIVERCIESAEDVVLEFLFVRGRDRVRLHAGETMLELELAAPLSTCTQ